MEILYYLAIAVGFYIFGLFTHKFFPSYISEKGKNLATKEDIKEITTISEGVKSLLTFNEKHKTRIKEKETEILIDFFEKCSHLDEKLMFNFGDLTSSEKNYPVEHEKYVNDLFFRIKISRQRLFLYLPVEHPLQKKAEKVFQLCGDIRGEFRRNFGALKISIWEEMDCLEKKEEKAVIKEKIQKSDEVLKNYNSAINTSYESFRKQLNDFTIEMQKHFAN